MAKSKPKGRLMWLTRDRIGTRPSPIYNLTTYLPKFDCGKWDTLRPNRKYVCSREFHKTSSIRLPGGPDSIRRVRVTIEEVGDGSNE